MADYLEPLSVLSLGSVLGVAQLGAAQLRDWFWRLHQGVINFEGNPQREEIGTACSREIDEVLAPVFDRLEAEGDESTITCESSAARTTWRRWNPRAGPGRPGCGTGRRPAGPARWPGCALSAGAQAR